MAAKSPPEGYHTVTPSIVVRNLNDALDFYQAAFGAEVLYRMTGPDGSVMHAEMRIGDSIIMLGPESEQWGSKSPLSTNGNPQSLLLYVADADAAVDKAVKAGAIISSPLEDAFWGDRYGKVTDPFGHDWAIATHLRDLSPDEMKAAMDQWMAQQAGA
ncbi:MAG TPA: VOC family protein [Gemmatimonadales bacterium]|nr:VOC family protein [Gemmatimonadales bacterium]